MQTDPSLSLELQFFQFLSKKQYDVEKEIRTADAPI